MGATGAKRKSGKRQGVGISPRARAVWLALTCAMTLVGGGLLLLDGHPAARGDGMNLPALAATGTVNSMESVLTARKPLDGARWKSIVIHHSGAPSGSPSGIESEHLKLGFKGLGHHFVIGNGRGMDDGEVHVGYRWLDQLPGAHCRGADGPWYNNHAISICLVGDGERQTFSPAQMDRLANLVLALANELKIPADKIVLQSQVASWPDPGRLFPEAWLRERLKGLR